MRRPFALLLSLSVAGCATPAPVATPARPAFVDDLIAGFEADPVANPPASIWRYAYRGGPVWYVPPRCCDLPGVLYAPDGTAICEPDGGLTGRGDGRCADFAAARRDGVLAWTDPRR